MYTLGTSIRRDFDMYFWVENVNRSPTSITVIRKLDFDRLNIGFNNKTCFVLLLKLCFKFTHELNLPARDL